MFRVRLMYGDRQSEFDLDDYIVKDGWLYPKYKRSKSIMDGHILPSNLQHVKSIDELKIICDMKNCVIFNSKPKYIGTAIITVLGKRQYDRKTKTYTDIWINKKFDLTDYLITEYFNGEKWLIHRTKNYSTYNHQLHPRYSNHCRNTKELKEFADKENLQETCQLKK